MVEENIFDPEPYNYLFNKSTVFIDSEFVFKDHRRLENVLQKFEQKDTELLGILSYCKELYEDKHSEKEVGTKISALHRSVDNGNKFSVDIILKYLSLLKEDSSINFR